MDLIDRQAAIDVLEERLQANGYCNVALASELNRSIGYLMRLPTVEAEPVRHGKWVKKWHTGFHKELPCCSVCGYCAVFWWDYCPNCGARQDGD